MKKITLLAAVAFAFSISACKKDRTCECTTTFTATDGTVTTTPNNNVSFKKIKKGGAKTLCQKETTVNVYPNGDTETTVNDCKLK